MKEVKKKTEFKDDDEFFEFLNLAWDLEKEWQDFLPRPSAKELLEIFPEAKKIIQPQIKEWEEKREALVSKIRKKLTVIKHSNSDKFSKWFWREWVKVNEGAELLEIDKQIIRLKHLSSVAKGRPPSTGGVTEEMIQQALAVPIENIISQKLKRSGDKLFGLCPLHNEKHPSFFFYLKSNSFYCYGCGVGGNVINLIKLLHDFNFIEAVKWLNNK